MNVATIMVDVCVCVWSVWSVTETTQTKIDKWKLHIYIELIHHHFLKSNFMPLAIFMCSVILFFLNHFTIAILDEDHQLFTQVDVNKLVGCTP